MDRQVCSNMKAAEVVDVGQRTSYNWLAAGEAAYVRTADGYIRIVADSLWGDPHAPTVHEWTPVAGRWVGPPA